MRQRNRKHLDERLTNLGGMYSDKGDILDDEFLTHPLHMEIGCGKGRFITTLANLNPDVHYIASEMIANIIVLAAEKAQAMELNNIRFVSGNVQFLADAIPAGSVDRIYLNFSDPWPKDRHAKRRLPSRQFLNRFDQILKEDGRISFKTDNRELFDFAIEELEPAGWKAEVITYDLHADAVLCDGNVMTEYEEKFSSMGNPIYKYIIRR